MNPLLHLERWAIYFDLPSHECHIHLGLGALEYLLNFESRLYQTCYLVGLHGLGWEYQFILCWLG